MSASASGGVVVSGATRGIGRAIAEVLVERGRSVVALARDEAALAALAATHPGKVAYVRVDLARPDERAGLVERIVAAGGALPGGFVHAAGLAQYVPALEVRPEGLREQLEIHAMAPFELARELATRWIAERVHGSVVTLSSTLASRPAPFTVAYAMAKAAQEAMVRGLALELAPHGIRFNAVAPGVVDTDMVRAERPDALASTDARLEALARLHPIGRLGRAHEVAETVVHALDATFMTGTTLVVDGGLLVG